MSKTVDLHCGGVDFGLKSDRYQCLSQLGVGSFGTVFKALDKQTGEIVAIKHMYRGNRFKQKDLEREIEIMKRLNRVCQDSAVCYKEVFEVGDWTNLVTDFVEGMTFDQFTSLVTLIPVTDMISVMYNIFYSLYKIHSQGIAHNDIHPHNVMVLLTDDDMQIKFIDFGLSCWDECSPRGRLGYMDEGKLSGMGKSSRRTLEEAQKSDIFAVGVMLYELMTAQHPHNYPQESPTTPKDFEDWITAVKRSDDFIRYNPQDADPLIVESINRIVLLCLADDASQRPTAKELFQMVTVLDEAVPVDA